MTKSHACPECGGSLPPNTPQGLCPRCLLGAAISDTISYAPGGSTPTGNPQTPAWPMDLETFRIAVVELGLMGAEELASYAAAASVDVSGLARALVRARKLTPYQAGALTQGKGRGLLIGNYLVLEKRGQGGMGIVFKARDRRTGRLVALKILPPSFGRDPEAVQRFRREFKLASRLNHPNIVAALDADEDRGVQFLTMDYIEGHDLDDLVSEVGPLPIKLATHCLIQAASGLEAAHAQGIVHRDIKPSNLMLDSSGAVRVLDLGLARVMEAASPIGQSVDGSGGLTLSGAYMGTVDFVAPEQADNSKKANHLADIYSLGCTIHFLLTGRSPFDGDTMLKRLMAHQTRPAPSLRAARPDVPAALEDAYQAMMAKRPTDRPPSMTRVIAMLEACQASANESKEARATLKTFAGTVMQQASPKRQAWDVESANFTRPTLRDHPRLDPHLNLADLGIDFRDDEEENAGPAYEEVGPPKFRRLGAIGERFRRQPAELVLWAFALLGFCVAASMLVPRRRLEPPTVRQAEPKPWAVAQAKPEPWAAQPKFEEAIETESAPNSEPKVSVPHKTPRPVPYLHVKPKIKWRHRKGPPRLPLNQPFLKPRRQAPSCSRTTSAIRPVAGPR
ncbi:protein kinase [Singulisphaera sp. Ch08]|uniref:Protein kinase n=1 Tax=Singulisphaera sp. Ch08 TaxID=3120278 RepID=A0AAU7CFQ2_9BACT